MEKKGPSKVAIKPIAGKPPRARPTKKPVRSSTAARQLSASSRTRASANKLAKTSHPASPGISITVQIPQLRRPKNASSKPAPNSVSRRRLLHTGVAVVVVMVVAVGSYYGIRLHGREALTPAVAEAAVAVRTEPNYDPLVPSDVETTSKSYDGQKNVVAYDTTFSEARLTVSEQALPANFTTDPTAILRAADSINAKQKIDTVKGTIFIATSDTDKSQMGLFASKTVLVFIHTDKTLDDVSWKSFVELLTQKSWQDFNKSNG